MVQAEALRHRAVWTWRETEPWEDSNQNESTFPTKNNRDGKELDSCVFKSCTKSGSSNSANLWGTDPATGARQGQPWNPEKKEKHRKAEQKRFWALDFKWFTLFVKLLKEKLENQGSRCASFPRSAFACLVGRPGRRRCRRQLGPLTWQWLQWEAQEI